MPNLICDPAFIPAGDGKLIEEYVGVVNSGTATVSVAHMHSPEGWAEPGQTPEFDEFTLVLTGCLRIEHKDGVMDVLAGQAVIAHKGEWVRYSTPAPGGAEYVAVCVPAFTPAAARRDPGAEPKCSRRAFRRTCSQTLSLACWRSGAPRGWKFWT